MAKIKRITTVRLKVIPINTGVSSFGCPLKKIEIKSNKNLSKTGKFRLFEETRYSDFNLTLK